MATTNFVNSVTLTDAAWFNDVDAVTYEGTFPAGITALAFTGATTFTAFAGATTLLTLGGTGASAVVALPGTLEASGTTGALTVAGGVYIAKKLNVVGVATFTAQPILSSLTASLPVFSDGSKGLVSNAMTGTGNVVMSASPTLTGTLTAEAITASGAIAGATGAFGTTPAVAGTIRLPNAVAISARNAANSADLELLKSTATNVTVVGEGLTASVANGATLDLGVLQTGLLVIVSNADYTGVFVLSSSTPTEISDPQTAYSAAQGTASSYNVYNSGGSVILENNRTAATFFITLIK